MEIVNSTVQFKSRVACLRKPSVTAKFLE